MRQHIDMDRRNLTIRISLDLEDHSDKEAAMLLLRALGILDERHFQSEVVRILTPVEKKEASA